MTSIKVDGKEYEVKAGSNVLDALLSIGINVPYFCWHPAMGSIGACRQCAVLQYANDDDTRGRIVMSCMTPVSDGARFSVEADNATQFRESVIENLMLNHPHDCPVCEEGGECHLQDMTVMVGHNSRHYDGKKTTFRNQYLGPFIGHEMNRCITCYRCVRFYQDYAGGDDLGAFASRDRVYFGRAEQGLLENEFAGNLVEVCPTGVFTDKTLSKNYTRKWDLQSAPTVCVVCSLGCNTYTSERYGEIRRVHNRFHSEVNGYFLCDRGRFGAGFVNSDKRIRQAGIKREDGLYEPVSLDLALDSVREMISTSKKVVGIGSPRASLESNHALRSLVGEDNYCNGMSNIEREMHGIILEAHCSHLNMTTLAGVESFDAILILGEDITNHVPRLALSVRQATRNKAKALGQEKQLVDWQDAAVRELAQADRSPVVIITPMPDRLDDVACQKIRLNTTDIAILGFEIAAGLEGSAGSDACSDICSLLKEAKKPLIITGTSLQNPDILRAGVNIGIALQKYNNEAAIFLCASDCNSLGVTALGNQNSMEGLLSHNPDLLLVLENDLSQSLGFDFKEKIKSVKQLVVIDHLDNKTVSECDVVLPAATFAEAEGTYINTEGRAQRSEAVFSPAVFGASELSGKHADGKSDIQASFHLLDALADIKRTSSELRQDLIAANSGLIKIKDAAPLDSFRVEGSKLSRMTHRSSGRTAMLADRSVHEPQQAIDQDSAMSFSMEGVQQQAPSSLRAFTWSPGWNSNQSIHKFQSEVGGDDKQGNAGCLVFEKTDQHSPYEDIVKQKPTLIAKHHIFGSESLSTYASELASLVPQPYLMMNIEMAERLQVKTDDGLSCITDDEEIQFAVIVDAEIPDGCVIYPSIAATRCITKFENIDQLELNKIEGFVPVSTSPKLIATDGGR